MASSKTRNHVPERDCRVTKKAKWGKERQKRVTKNCQEGLMYVLPRSSVSCVSVVTFISIVCYSGYRPSGAFVPLVSHAFSLFRVLEHAQILYKTL